MIVIKSKREIELMREPCKVTAELLHDLADFIKPGISTQDISEFRRQEDYIARNESDVQRLQRFSGCSLRIGKRRGHSRHSRQDRKLAEGDIVSVDVGATYKGYNSDAARTYPVGVISEEDQKLIDVTRECFFEGIKYAMEGYRINDIGHAVQKLAESNGMGVVRDFTGHGTGSALHEDPMIPNYGKAGTGARIKRK